MRIIHLSDLHFGTQENKIVQDLLHSIVSNKPDLVIISGDFTQIATKAEFESAGEFLNALPCPYFCVPGNHDIPARNLKERFLNPYKKYRAYIADDLCPTFENQDVTIAGLNSARRMLPHYNWANGAISEDQRLKLAACFESNESKWKICTFHHPIHKVKEMPLSVTVFGGEKTLEVIQSLKIDVVLTGHVHHASITTLGDEEHQTIYLSASTALSSRTRGQENGYNVIELEKHKIKIDIFTYQSDEFVCTKTFQSQKSS